MTNVGDEKEVKKRQTKVDKAKEFEREALRSVLDTYAGRLVIWRLLERFAIFRSTPIVNELQLAADVSAMNHGKTLLADVMEAHPTIYMQMANEADERKKQG